MSGLTRNILKGFSASIEKASVLLEAMPYLQAFRGTIFVIKTGGTALHVDRERRQLLQDILFLSLAGVRPILVHGGGVDINKQLKARGLAPHFVEGLRVTDKVTLSVVAKTLTELNRQLISELRELGGQAVGFSGARDRILEARRVSVKGRDIGWVGKIHRVHVKPIRQALNLGKIPVVAPLGFGAGGQTYNVNADLAAAALAGALKAEKFVLVTDVLGILRRQADAATLISTCSASQVKKLIRQGIVSGGMIPKTRACIEALRGGVRKTHMIHCTISHGLLLEIFTDRGIGTEMVMR